MCNVGQADLVLGAIVSLKGFLSFAIFLCFTPNLITKQHSTHPSLQKSTAQLTKTSIILGKSYDSILCDISKQFQDLHGGWEKQHTNDALSWIQVSLKNMTYCTQEKTQWHTVQCGVHQITTLCREHNMKLIKILAVSLQFITAFD